MHQNDGVGCNQENSVERPPLTKTPLFLEKFSIPLCLVTGKSKAKKAPSLRIAKIPDKGVYLLNSPDSHYHNCCSLRKENVNKSISNFDFGHFEVSSLSIFFSILIIITAVAYV